MIKLNCSPEITPEVDDYIQIVVRTCVRVIPSVPGYDLDDYFQEGRIAYLRAVEHWKPGNGTEFHSFAVTCIRRRIWTLWKRHMKTTAETPEEDFEGSSDILAALGTSARDEFHNIESAMDIEPLLEILDQKRKSRKKTEALGAEAMLMAVYDSAATFEKTAKARGVTRQYVSQCVNRLRKSLEKEPVFRSFRKAYGCDGGAASSTTPPEPWFR